MHTYRVRKGSFYHEGRMYDEGESFTDIIPSLCKTFTSLEYVGCEYDGAHVPTAFEARHVVTNKWGVFHVATDNLILNRYVPKKRACMLAAKANRGTLGDDDKEVHLALFKELYAHSCNT
jgi:hypothetical protein